MNINLLILVTNYSVHRISSWALDKADNLFHKQYLGWME